ncbi:hypothetical protein CHS0354_025988 [Potamilus streckersoni]|uniref:Cadherin domain-containing protein n=1 Tax=Potamilus streckersoni TaxID=2493646 RepID=A0AAE0W7L0_9BIVA|nr:hypothetical protein CHS0354_025988 [Potamilus streckersoni]
MDKTVLLFLSVIQGIAAIRIIKNFYEIPPLHEDTDEERAIVELKTEMHWSIGWLHGVHCELQDNGYGDLFFIDGKTVKKHACSSPGCGPTCYASGCLSYLRKSDYVLKIRCDQNLFNIPPLTTNSDTAEMRIFISKNQEPKVFIDPGNVNLLASEACTNGIIARVSYTDVEGNDVKLTYTGSDNFRLSQEYTSGSILIEKDLQNEKSNTFTVTVSARDRRNTVTQSLQIRLIATMTTTTITAASTNLVTEELVTPSPSIEVPILTASTNRVTEELVTSPPSIEVPILTASTNRVTEELVTSPPSIEVPILTASTNRVTEELVTSPPLIEVPIRTDGNPIDTLSTATISTNRLTEVLITTPLSMRVSIPTDRKPTDAVMNTGIAPSYTYSNDWTVTSTTTEREKGDRIPPSKDIHKPVPYILIALAVMASFAAAAVIIVWIKRHPRINGYRKLKENADDLDEAQEAGFDNPTYVLITGQKT